MPVTNSDITDVLGQIAELLELEGTNPFRIRAYRNAARTVPGLQPRRVDARHLALGMDDLDELAGGGAAA